MRRDTHHRSFTKRQINPLIQAVVMISNTGCNYFRGLKYCFQLTARADRNMDKPLGLRGLRNHKRCYNDITFPAGNISYSSDKTEFEQANYP